MRVMPQSIPSSVLILALAACAASDRSKATASPPPASDVPSALAPATRPAPDGSVMRVFVEPDRVVGWIGGSRSYQGVTARLVFADREYATEIGADNTFAIAVSVTKPTNALVRAGNLLDSVELVPAIKEAASAYIVSDRSAYRPGQKLQLAAFLRTADHEPVAHAKTELSIVSDTKLVTAGKLALVSDAEGRIAAEYTFSHADPLDTYTLKLAGYTGLARVTLGEYRKSKVKLAVDSSLVGRHAELTFRALDFLDKPVPGGAVTFTAQIVDDPKAGRVDIADSFGGGGPAESFDRHALLHYLSGVQATPSGTGVRVASETKGKLELDANGVASYRIPVKSELMRGRHRLLVDALIVDANGHEQRTTKAIPLARANVRLELATAAELVAAGAPIDVSVRVIDGTNQAIAPASASIAAIRLVPALSYDLGYRGYHGNAYSPNGVSFGNGLDNNINVVTTTPNGGPIRLWRGRSFSQPGWQSQPTEVLAATTAVIGNTARIELEDAGAYRLVASAKLTDGTTVWSELGVAVREPEAGPALMLGVDREQVREGEKLIGTLQGSYRDAPVLVVVRDARGIRARHRVALVHGRARFELPTAGVGYGATVDAYMMGDNGEVHAAQQLVRIDQVSKRIAITTTTKETYGPGDTVELDIAVDRSEPVDLVVSVFDRSILSVAQDRSVDPHAFFHADARMHTRAALHALRAELGSITVREIYERARLVVKREGPEHAAARNAATTLIYQIDHSNHVNGYLVGSMLHHTNAAVAMLANDSGIAIGRQELLASSVIDIVERLPDLALRRVADQTVIYRPGQTFVASGSDLGVSFSGYSVSGNAYDVSGNSVHSYVAPQSAAPAAPSALDITGDTSGDVVRRDFSDSAYWSALTRTGVDGKARVRFKLPDSLTNWQVTVTAVGKDLHVGRTIAKLRTVRDVMIWPMLPRRFVEGDTVAIYGTVHNLTDHDKDLAVALEAQGVELVSPKTVTIRVPSKTNVPVTWQVRAKSPGTAQLLMSASGVGISDASLKRIPIHAPTAEQIVTASGFADRPLTLALPAGIDPKSARLEVTFAPTLAADMLQTLDYLVEYPYGCAEQTMSRFAPAIRVAGILDRLGVKDGALAKRLPGVVDGGLRRLAELQQSDGGWGWHGHAATHEMITPYVVWGLLEAEKAGFKLTNPGVLRRGIQKVHALHFATDRSHVSDRMYLAYVYSQKQKLSDAWWEQIVGDAPKASDYALALALEMAAVRGDKANAEKFAITLEKRARKAHGGKHWVSAGFSRWGDDPFETTAVVLKAFAAYDAKHPIIPDVIAFFVATKRGDRWNSTKDTAMVLYAMSDLLAKKGAQGTGPALFVDYAVDHGAAQHLAFTDGKPRTVTIDGSKLSRSTTVSFAKASHGMMARAVLRYRTSSRTLAPANHGLAVQRQLHLLGAKGVRIRELKSGDRVPRGAYLESVVTVKSQDPDVLRFLLIEDPKPAGAEAMPIRDPRFDRPIANWVFREDRESHLAFHFETAQPQQTQVSTVLHVELSGDLVIPPAQSELMYATTTRGHSGSFALKVD